MKQGTKKHKIKLGNAGLTLVEIMIVAVLLIIFSIFLVSLFIISNHAWQIESSSVAVRQQAQQAMEYMSKELRESSVSTAKTIPNPYGVTIPAAPNNTSICFGVPTIVSGEITDWTQIIYEHDSTANEIVRKQGGSGCTATCAGGTSCKTLARNIESLLFAKSNNFVDPPEECQEPPSCDVVTATVMSQLSPTGGTPKSTTLSLQITLRN